MVRPPAVAGQFYPGDPQRLRATVDSLLVPAVPRQPAMGLLVPHAGYLYSGSTAGKVFSRVQIPARMILLGVNHHGVGRPFALCTQEAWRTPLGDVELDAALASALLNACPSLEEDSTAHALEHSLEVELPFLQRIREDVNIVPIVFGSHEPAALRAIGTAIANTVRGAPGPVLLLSSSDMNHFESEEVSRRKDQLAIDAMLDLNPVELQRVCEQEAVTMCGVAPMCVMLTALKALGATHAELIDHRTSGDATGDYSSVVGYVGMKFA